MANRMLKYFRENSNSGRCKNQLVEQCSDCNMTIPAVTSIDMWHRIGRVVAIFDPRGLLKLLEVETGR